MLKASCAHFFVREVFLANPLPKLLCTDQSNYPSLLYRHFNVSGYPLSSIHFSAEPHDEVEHCKASSGSLDMTQYLRVHCC